MKTMTITSNVNEQKITIKKGSKLMDKKHGVIAITSLEGKPHKIHTFKIGFVDIFGNEYVTTATDFGSFGWQMRMNVIFKIA